jgi:transposase
MEAYKRLIAFKELYEFEGYKSFGILSSSDSYEICLRKDKQTGCCPECNLQRRKVIERNIRTIRDLDLCGKKCYLRIEIDRIECSCGYRGIEYLDFLSRYARYTKRFEEYVALLCERMSLTDVSEIAKIDWKTAKNIDKQNLKKLIKDIRIISPKRIGVDEIAYEKGHKYLTIVRDLDAGVIWIGEGRQKETLDKFFKMLGKEKASQIELAVIDMWDPYIASISENTIATIVFDKFHISKRVNEALDLVRKKEFANADEKERKEMKHKRFLILARQERLDKYEKESLNNLMQLNKELYKAYILKEQILDIFAESNEKSACERLQKWIENVAISGIKQFEKVVNTIERYFYGLLNYFRYRVNNAASEGFNTKITVIKRRAYGFRDLEYFKLKILQSCSRD